MVCSKRGGLYSVQYILETELSIAIYAYGVCIFLRCLQQVSGIMNGTKFLGKIDREPVTNRSSSSVNLRLEVHRQEFENLVKINRICLFFKNQRDYFFRTAL